MYLKRLSMIEKSRIDMLAKEARRLYCRFMRRHVQAAEGRPSNYGSKVIPQYDGTTSSRPRPGEAVLHKYGKDFKPVWPKLAAASVKGEVTLLELIRSQFDCSAFGPPAATACHSSRAVSNAIGRRSSSRQELFNLMSSYKQMVSTAFAASADILDKPGVYADIVLNSETSPFYKVNTLLFIDEVANANWSDLPVAGQAVDEYLLKLDLFESVWSKWTHPLFSDKALNVLRKERAGLQIETEETIL